MRNKDNQNTSNINKILIIVISILVIFIAALLGRFLALRQDTVDSVGLVANIYMGINYNTRLITTYNEYETILSENNINIDKKDKLKEKDFQKYDFVVDFIPYDSSLVVDNIDLNLTDEGVIINYKVNKSVEANTQMLIYFIPIKKGKISNFVLANRHFEYAN